jgi:hypothetical protein
VESDKRNVVLEPKEMKMEIPFKNSEDQLLGNPKVGEKSSKKKKLLKKSKHPPKLNRKKFSKSKRIIKPV